MCLHYANNACSIPSHTGSCQKGRVAGTRWHTCLLAPGQEIASECALRSWNPKWHSSTYYDATRYSNVTRHKSLCRQIKMESMDLQKGSLWRWKGEVNEDFFWAMDVNLCCNWGTQNVDIKTDTIWVAKTGLYKHFFRLVYIPFTNLLLLVLGRLKLFLCDGFSVPSHLWRPTPLPYRPGFHRL